jgi:hypothetical protein
MAIDQMTQDALGMEHLKELLPQEPRVVRVTPEDYVDADGDDALRVTVVLADGTTDEQITGENVWAIKLAIRDSLRAKGIRLFPYIFLVTEQDLASQAEDEE